MDFTKTIIPLALMASESIAHSAFGIYMYVCMYGKHFLFQFRYHRNVLPLKFRVTLTLTSSPVLDLVQIVDWSISDRVDIS